MRLFGIEFCAVFGITDPVHDSAPRSYRQPRGEDNRSLVAPRSDFGTKSRFLSSQTEFSLWDAPSRTQQPPIARSQEPRHSHFGAEPLPQFLPRQTRKATQATPGKIEAGIFSKITVFYFREEEVMKIRLLLALVGLAISFALPT